MNEPLITYQTYPSYEKALEVAKQLEDAGIMSEVAKKVLLTGSVFVGHDYSNDYSVKIAGEDFEKANEILINSMRGEVNDALSNQEHPLYSLNNEELKDVIAKRDEWGPENYQIALAILKSRNIVITDNEINQLQQERIHVLAEKKPMSGIVLFIGYFTSVFPVARNMPLFFYPIETTGGTVFWFPGLLGLVIPMIILISKTTLPNGKRVAVYDDKTMKHGTIILVLNILAWIVNFILFSGLL